MVGASAMSYFAIFSENVSLDFSPSSNTDPICRLESQLKPLNEN